MHNTVRKNSILARHMRITNINFDTNGNFQPNFKNHRRQKDRQTVEKCSGCRNLILKEETFASKKNAKFLEYIFANDLFRHFSREQTFAILPIIRENAKVSSAKVSSFKVYTVLIQKEFGNLVVRVWLS